MIAPGEKQIVQIIATSYCDLACGNCTQLIAQQSARYHMNLADFRTACLSLADWTGIVGVFGGNPCLHPQFPELCRIMVDVFPDKRRRGLWSNRVFGHGDLIRETFGYLNLVVHDNHEAAEEMRAAGLGPVHGDGKRAMHSPVLVALKDVIPNAAERTRLIDGCQININWSGAIDQDADGNLRAWYCEVASSMARAYGRRGGIPVTPGWWKCGMDAWSSDVVTWCHSCGVPLRGLGHQDREDTDDYSISHAALIQLRPRRNAVMHDAVPAETTAVATDYLRLHGKEN